MAPGQIGKELDATTSRSDKRCERRSTQHALNCWTEARRNDDIPNLADLTVNSERGGLPKVFSDNQFLIMFEAQTANSVVIYYGENLPNMPVRRDLGDNMQQSLPTALKEIFQDACLEAVNKSDVVYRHGMIKASASDSILYRSIFMPLRSDTQPDRIYVFGAFSNETGGTELLAAA